MAISSAPAALAESPHKSIDARFAFNPNDPAARIYADLTRTAERTCGLSGKRPLSLLRGERACIQEMVQDGVNKLGRADVAAVHNGYFATANAGDRG